MRRALFILLLMVATARGQSTSAIANFPFNFPSPAPTTTKALTWNPAASNALGGTGAIVFSTPAGGATVPTGTGYYHITVAGTLDAAAKNPTDAEVTFSNITTGNATTGQHGFLPILDGNTAHFLNGNGAWATPVAGSGTVTNTGTLTANAIVLGNGTVDTKVVAGITTNGTAKLTLGQASTSTGTIDLLNTTGTTTIQPLATSGTTTLSLPSTSGTLALASSITTVASDTIWDTKGDLAVATIADTATKLAAGANDTMLMADSAQSTGLKWGNPTTVKTALGLTIGTNVQAYDADLTTWAGITPGTGVGTALAINVGSAGAFVTTSSTDTLTNKTISSSVIQPRVTTSSTSNTTPTPNCDTDDIYNAISMTVNMAFGAPTGTPFAGQKLIIKIQGTAARTVSFATGSSGAYRFSTDIPVPTTTTTTKLMYLGFIWHNGDSRWDCVGKTDGF